jgi:hypothetical protein
MKIAGTLSGAARRNRSPKGIHGFFPAAADRAIAVTTEAGTPSTGRRIIPHGGFGSGSENPILAPHE